MPRLFITLGAPNDASAEDAERVADRVLAELAQIGRCADESGGGGVLPASSERCNKNFAIPEHKAGDFPEVTNVTADRL